MLVIHVAHLDGGDESSVGHVMGNAGKWFRMNNAAGYRSSLALQSFEAPCVEYIMH